MSKTAKTNPFYVRIANGDLIPHPLHDHRNGLCDLTTLEELAHAQDAHGVRCRWYFSYDGRNICGCPMCTEHEWRRAERRASRHDSKRAVIRLIGQYNASHEVNDEVSALVH